MPRFRTFKYSQWLACERLGLLPPGVVQEWDKNTPATHADILAYNSVREKEDFIERDRSKGVRS